MGAGFWWISCVDVRDRVIPLESEAPWKEVKHLRAAGVHVVNVDPIAKRVTVREQCLVEESPLSQLDVGVTDFMTFMRLLRDKSVLFKDYFKWRIGFVSRGESEGQVISPCDVLTTLACWDDVMAEVFEEAAEAELDIDIDAYKRYIASARQVFAFAAANHRFVAVDVSYN
jgi:hypothetical protein